MSRRSDARLVGSSERRARRVVDDLGRGADVLAVDLAECDGLDDVSVPSRETELFARTASEPGRSLWKPVGNGRRSSSEHNAAYRGQALRATS
jgi:hypothetical protein